MKRLKLILVIYLLLFNLISIYIYEPKVPWLLIYPFFIKRTREVQKEYHNRTIKEKDNFTNKIKSKLRNNTYIFMENDYPYNVNAKHYVLWLQYYFENEKINQIIKHELYNKSYIYYENPINIRSIPEIIHYHVFSKN